MTTAGPAGSSRSRSWWSSVPNDAEQPTRVVVTPDGPILLEGPVEVVGADGTVDRSDRFVVAVCACRRTGTPPWCDTSHRPHRHPAGPGTAATSRSDPSA